MLNIMVVDDDMDDLFFFKEAVATMGEDFCCTEVSSGVEALKILKSPSSLPDVIFLDLNMPKMDGRECLFELKKEARLKPIAVIIYSTTSNENDHNYCMDLGAAGFFVKVTDTTKIKDGIINALSLAGIELPVH